jgi:teichuronic acid biosynthesis glycosyltransferase TuaG
MHAKVSIITPVYNSFNHLHQTINSVLSQTYVEWEYILVDDCSTDGSFDVLTQYANSNSKIKVIQLDNNSGPAAARNAGILNAVGRYIAFCDSDDVWHPSKLSKQIVAMENSHASICVSSYIKIMDDGTITDRVIFAKSNITYSMMLSSNYIGCSTAIYDVNKCGKVYMPDIRRAEDYALWLNLLKNGCVVIGVKEPLVYYRLSSGSESSNKTLTAYGHWCALRSISDENIMLSVWHFIMYIFISVRKQLS